MEERALQSGSGLAHIRTRVTTIRRRVIAAATATFVVTWAGVFAQMVLGHDPALRKNALTTAPSQPAPAPAYQIVRTAQGYVLVQPSAGAGSPPTPSASAPTPQVTRQS